MKLEFGNFYAFEFSIGLGGLIFASNLISKNYWWITLFAVSFYILYDSIMRWDKSQKNAEKLTELEVQSKDATLDFDIQEVTGENDLDFEPHDFDDEGNPFGFETIATSSLTVRLNVYNPTGVSNLVRDVQVKIIGEDNSEEIYLTKNFSQIKILPRSHEAVVIFTEKKNFHGREGQEVIVQVTTLDGLVVTKEGLTSRFTKGPTLSDF